MVILNTTSGVELNGGDENHSIETTVVLIAETQMVVSQNHRTTKTTTAETRSA